MAHRYRLTLEYDGRPFFGWQRLRGKPTVQAALEEALARAFGQEVQVQGAGRTDRGAHALGQVAAFTLEAGPEPDELAEALARALPESIRVRAATRAPEGFHPRTDALGKEYAYRIAWDAPLPADLDGRVWHVRGKLDRAAMERALPRLVGTHDFASFATPTRFGQKSTVRTLSEARLEGQGARLEFTLRADSFLYHMVRNLIRLVVKVGEGKLPPERVDAILAARQRDASPGTAPASGLYLVRVFYPEGDGPSAG